jgi:hypothetical protein
MPPFRSVPKTGGTQERRADNGSQRRGWASRPGNDAMQARTDRQARVAVRHRGSARVQGCTPHVATPNAPALPDGMRGQAGRHLGVGIPALVSSPCPASVCVHSCILGERHTPHLPARPCRSRDPSRAIRDARAAVNRPHDGSPSCRIPLGIRMVRAAAPYPSRGIGAAVALGHPRQSGPGILCHRHGGTFFLARCGHALPVRPPCAMPGLAGSHHALPARVARTACPVPDGSCRASCRLRLVAATGLLPSILFRIPADRSGSRDLALRCQGTTPRPSPSREVPS